jgi:hypothetical protein
MLCRRDKVLIHTALYINGSNAANSPRFAGYKGRSVFILSLVSHQPSSPRTLHLKHPPAASLASRSHHEDGILTLGQSRSPHQVVRHHISSLTVAARHYGPRHSAHTTTRVPKNAVGTPRQSSIWTDAAPSLFATLNPKSRPLLALTDNPENLDSVPKIHFPSIG